MASNAQRHEAAHKAFNARDWDGVRALTAGQLRFTDQPAGITVKTAEEFIDWMGDWVAAFSDAAVSEPTYIDGGNTTVAQFTAIGTNDGKLSRMPEVPPTGARLHVPFAEVLHWNEEGKLISGEIYYDAMSIAVQLGLVPPQG